jgi:AhpD family alkylhydroperoxidase
MARIAEKSTPVTRMANWYTRRSYGRDTEIAGVMAHSRPNLLGYGTFEFFHERSKATDPKLLALAGTKASCAIGCEFCLDIASHISRRVGVTEEQLRTLHAYRDSPAFSPQERLVIEYADAMCQTPVSIPDELFARLQEQFTDEQIIELTTAVAIENFRARFNTALGITPAGFTEGQYCVLPDAVAAQAQTAERTSA